MSQILNWMPHVGSDAFFSKAFLPAFTTLAQAGHMVTTVLSDQFGALGAAKAYAQSSPSQAQLLEAADLGVDLTKRELESHEIKALGKAMRKLLGGFQPDVILSRGPNINYMAQLFPAAKLLHTMEGTLPGFLLTPTDLVAYPVEGQDTRLWGLPYFDQNSEAIVENYPLRSKAKKAVQGIRKKMIENCTNEVADKYVSELHKRFSAVILFPVEHFGAEWDFAITHHTLKGEQRATLDALLESSPDDYCFLPTFHPLDVKVEAPKIQQEKVKHFKAHFRDNPRVLFPDDSVGGTYPLVNSCDAMVMQYSKTGFLAMLLDKPIIRAGHTAIDFYSPIEAKNIAELKRWKAPSQELMDSFFAWIITHYKHPEGRFAQYLENIMRRLTDVNLKAGELYKPAPEEAMEKLRGVWAKTTGKPTAEFESL